MKLSLLSLLLRNNDTNAKFLHFKVTLHDTTIFNALLLQRVSNVLIMCNIIARGVAS